MKSALKILVFCACSCISGLLFAQKKIVNDQEARQIISLGLDKMYDFDFAGALVQFRKITAANPEHPAGYLLEALNIYWQHIPFDFTSQAYQNHANLLEKAIDKADKMLKKDEADPEPIFFLLTARSLKVVNIAHQGDYRKAVGEANRTYRLMMKGFEKLDELNEFYFSCGIYNYFREKYPEKHTVYKPFMVVFQSGNKQEGIKQLIKASEQTVFSKREALLYLADIYLYYEEQYSTALTYTEKLIKMHPKNMMFHLYHARAAILGNQFTKVIPSTDFLLNYSADIYYKATGHLYKAYIAEKYQKNYTEAKKHYLQAFQYDEKLGKRFDEQRPMMYQGLSDVYAKEGDKVKADYFAKKAKEAK